jgi:hypothetical protein
MSTCHSVRDTQSGHRSLYDWTECRSSHGRHTFYSVVHRLCDGELRPERRVCLIHRVWEGKVHLFFATAVKKRTVRTEEALRTRR